MKIKTLRSGCVIIFSTNLANFDQKTMDPWKYLNLVFRIRKSHLCVHVISCELANSGSQRNYFHINYIRLHQPRIHISIISKFSHKVQISNHITHLGFAIGEHLTESEEPKNERVGDEVDGVPGSCEVQFSCLYVRVYCL